jgi:succinoglycan biosynthesis transport protein ExoP
MAGGPLTSFEPRLPRAGERVWSPPATELALLDLAGLLRRQRGVLLACLILSVGLVMAYTVGARPVYESASMLRFEHEQVNLPQLVEQLTSENRISTEIEVLQGRSAAATVIDSLGLRAVLNRPRKVPITKLFSVLRVAATADAGTLRFRVHDDTSYVVWREGNEAFARVFRLGDSVTTGGVTIALSGAAVGEADIRLRVVPPAAALRSFKTALRVSRPARDADLIQIAFQSHDPDLASRAANLLAAHLIASRQSELEHRSGLAVNFLALQVDSVRQELDAAENTLQKYRTKAQAVAPQEQAKTQVERLAQLEANRAGLEAERQSLAEVIDEIRLDSTASPDRLSPYRRLLGFPSILRNQAANELLANLDMLENERSTLLRRRTLQDPDVKAITSRIEEVDAQLQGIATTYLAGLSKQVAGLDQIGRQFGRQLDQLPRVEVQTARLQRDAHILEELYSTMRTRLKEAEVTRAIQDPAVRVVDRAYPDDGPLRPKPLLNFGVSLVLGSLLGLTVALAREMSDRSVRSRSDALQAAGLPVLGAIPRLRGEFTNPIRRLTGNEKGRHVGALFRLDCSQDAPLARMLACRPAPSAGATKLAERLVLQPGTSGAYAEALIQLEATLALGFQDPPLKVLVFTSPLPGEGKTLTAINFALTAAARGKNVLLIDADTRCGVISQVFGCPRQPGLTDLLSNNARFKDAIQVLGNATTTLAILPTGALLGPASKELTVERLRQTLTAMRSRFDMVVIDSSPVNILADAALIGAAADGVILVARSGKTSRDALTFATGQLTATKAPVIGILINDIDLKRQQYDDASYKYLAEVEKYHAPRSDRRLVP